MMNNKKFHDAFNYALSCYPELDGVDVSLCIRDSNIIHAMNSLPSILSLFNRKKRRYFVYVNKGVHTAQLAEMSEEEAKGWFGHELGHILDYQNKSFFQMLLFGIEYFLSGKHRKEDEDVATLAAVDRGLGLHVVMAVEGLLHSKHVSENYKHMIKKFYFPSWEKVHVHTPQLRKSFYLLLQQV